MHIINQCQGLSICSGCSFGDIAHKTAHYQESVWLQAYQQIPALPPPETMGCRIEKDTLFCQFSLPFALCLKLLSLLLHVVAPPSVKGRTVTARNTNRSVQLHVLATLLVMFAETKHTKHICKLMSLYGGHFGKKLIFIYHPYLA